jgi:hypothetical protein
LPSAAAKPVSGTLKPTLSCAQAGAADIATAAATDSKVKRALRKFMVKSFQVMALL